MMGSRCWGRSALAGAQTSVGLRMRLGGGSLWRPSTTGLRTAGPATLLPPLDRLVLLWQRPQGKEGRPAESRLPGCEGGKHGAEGGVAPLLLLLAGRRRVSGLRPFPL